MIRPTRKYILDRDLLSPASIICASTCVNIKSGLSEKVCPFPGYKLTKRGQHECQ